VHADGQHHIGGLI